MNRRTWAIWVSLTSRFDWLQCHAYEQSAILYGHEIPAYSCRWSSRVSPSLWMSSTPLRSRIAALALLWPLYHAPAGAIAWLEQVRGLASALPI